MKLLIIDYLSPIGHIKFDWIHIQALVELGYELHLVGRKGHFPGFVENEQAKITELPERYYQTSKFVQLSSRVNGIKILSWIKSYINLEDYDRVIFLSYDILSLFFFNIKGQVLLINHNNVDQLDDKVKLFMTRRLPENYEHIALNEYMVKKLKELLPRRIVHYIPHGYLKNTNTQIRPSILGEAEKFIFCPVNRNYDAEIVSSLLTSSSFKEWLMSNGISFFVKKQLFPDSQGIVKVIDKLTDEEYTYMLSESMAVVLPYGEDFKYRCSGIFFECVAVGTPVIATERPNLLIYKNKANISFFTDEQSFINCLKQIIQAPRKSNNGLFDPKNYWKDTLN